MNGRARPSRTLLWWEYSGAILTEVLWIRYARVMPSCVHVNAHVQYRLPLLEGSCAFHGTRDVSRARHVPRSAK